MTADEMHEVFAEWNKGELDSYLIEITRDILAYKDDDGQPLVDKILDTAGQKGTGKWTVDLLAGPGHSHHADRRGGLFPLPVGHQRRTRGRREECSKAPTRHLQAIKPAVHRGHPQGALRLEDRLLRPGLHADARRRQGIQVEPELRRHRPDVARRLHHPQRVSWARSRKRSTRIPELHQPAAGSILQESHQELPAIAGATWLPPRSRRASRCRPSAPPWPSTTAIRSERLPANLLQAQRDYFGAHTYERVDKPRGQFFHTNWTGRGGQTASSTYTV